MIKNLIIIMVLLSSQIVAYEGDGVNLSCDTSQLYDPTETKITFYGDSRMDFVNNGGVYGNKSMDYILNIQPDNSLVFLDIYNSYITVIFQQFQSTSHFN
ncbi:MAG: hypothetical protein KDK54_23020 [Leptospiraceae bacterium]|nr:hypothetical protein [Leptospiraceae bacterium]